MAVIEEPKPRGEVRGWKSKNGHLASARHSAVGAPGPNLYIASEISGNKFAIAGGKPGAKVSWQVTGIRHDAYAEAHRVQVEEDKGKERGTYLHPELFPQELPALARK